MHLWSYIFYYISALCIYEPSIEAEIYYTFLDVLSCVGFDTSLRHNQHQQNATVDHDWYGYIYILVITITFHRP